MNPIITNRRNMIKIVFATNNLNKLHEVQAQLPKGIKLISLKNIGCSEDIPETQNTIQTILYERNFLKLYEAQFVNIGYGAGLGSGLNFRVNFQYQNRLAQPNLTKPLIFVDHINRSYSPNTPSPASNDAFEKHQAATLTGVLTWQTGGKYIELPEQKIGVGSKAPTFTLTYKKGVPNLLGSDVDYSKWSLNVSDDLPLGLGGTLQYRATMGGFINANKLYAPDLQHYFGNQAYFSIEHLKGFQLLPYYQFSNQSRFYSTVFAEYHLNGLITNKIPGFRNIYNILKKVSDTVLNSSTESFRKAFLIQYPTKGIWVIAFQSGDYQGEAKSIIGEEIVNLFVPTTPNPTSGFFVLIPKKDAFELDISVEDAFKLVISAGVVTPNSVKIKGKKKK